jgi:myo-inositol 2-dehydrogenase/D-chiro-inositol 1-dehydrogenase
MARDERTRAILCAIRDQDVDVAPVRIGVLGVGRIGRMHAELLAHRVPGAALGMVYDPEPTASALVAQALDVPVAASDEELLANDELDAVAICTSTDTHVALLVAAASSGKAIFCEKPISLDLVEVDQALAAVDAAGARLQIGFNRRFDPAHRYVRDAVASGSLGALHLLRISSRDPAPPPLAYIVVSGGIFLDMTSHDIDMARFVTGSEIVEVYAQGAVRVDPAIGDAGDLDTAVLTMRHADGCLTVIDNSRRAAYGYDQRVEAFGAKGMAASDNPTAHTATTITAQGSHGSALPYFFVERYQESYLLQWEAFCDYVRNGGASPVSGEDGRAPLAVGLAAWRSVRERRPVEV